DDAGDGGAEIQVAPVKAPIVPGQQAGGAAVDFIGLLAAGVGGVVRAGQLLGDNGGVHDVVVVVSRIGVGAASAPAGGVVNQDRRRQQLQGRGLLLGR